MTVSLLRDLPQRDLLDVPDQGGGIGTTVRLDRANDDIESLPAELVGILEHLVGLADAAAAPM